MDRRKDQTYCVIQGSTHQELQRQVVRAFARIASIVALGIIPVELR